MGAGFTVTFVGYYKRFMLIGSVVMSVAAGLITMLKVDSLPGTFRHWLWLKCAAGLLCQPVLPSGRGYPVRHGGSCLRSDPGGGTVFISVGQNVFTNRFTAELKAFAAPSQPYGYCAEWCDSAEITR